MNAPAYNLLKDRADLGPQVFTLVKEASHAGPEEALAIGVLSQAARDLRRFYSATTGLKRELYLDAYAWLRANDFSWPYSFVNVCGLLHVAPETIRAELLADASLGWFGHWVNLSERLSRLLWTSFIRVFAKSNNPDNAELNGAFQRL